MKIKLTTVYVDNQENALRFYTGVLGFVKKADFTQGPFRWLTVASPEDPDGTELQLALNRMQRQNLKLGSKLARAQQEAQERCARLLTSTCACAFAGCRCACCCCCC